MRYDLRWEPVPLTLQSLSEGLITSSVNHPHQILIITSTNTSSTSFISQLLLPIHLHLTTHITPHLKNDNKKSLKKLTFTWNEIFITKKKKYIYHSTNKRNYTIDNISYNSLSYLIIPSTNTSCISFTSPLLLPTHIHLPRYITPHSCLLKMFLKLTNLPEVTEHSIIYLKILALTWYTASPSPTPTPALSTPQSSSQPTSSSTTLFFHCTLSLKWQEKNYITLTIQRYLTINSRY